MNIFDTGINGAKLIKQLRHNDERGYFTRSYCQASFQQLGLESNIVQSSESWNNKKWTLRGMHYQSTPFQEVKVVRCLKGKLLDVILDLRKESPSYLKHFKIELSEFDGQMVYVPEGVAHGFMTLEENTVIGYSMLKGEFSSEHATGVRWDDPAFNIKWHYEPAVISERDANYPLFD